ncbi:helix-turn-helix domain-containing protein [Paenibacillus sp. OV219]|uniref:helix-turn-helix domain-containing protein n=1 Tax=Paenibacillus sp. OV219 TaxID=1884377 RepID=UPI0008C5572F|nr:helix-turn-helix domain-containing protein [Paenibacillus sp. OV219]SEO30165.1 Helix-turn-helix domain-containing protein [Paenibacillus sp. OV219]
MRQIMQLRINTHSIFAKIMMSFIAIIFLFVSFNLVSLALFRQSIHGEIITYNDSNLTHTTYGMEKYFDLLNNSLVGLYLDRNLGDLQKAKHYYLTAGNVIDDIQKLTLNPQLYLKNMLVYDVKHRFVLDNSRGNRLDVMFSEHYVSRIHAPGFWQQELTAASSDSKLYPVDSFSSDTAPQTDTNTERVLPYLFRSKLYPDYEFLAFIDVDLFYRDYHQSINDNFYMLSPQGEVLYSSGLTASQPLPELKSGKDWVKQSRNYYFYKTGNTTGLTYVNIIPESSISKRLIRLNVTLIVLLFVSVVISAALSVLFSKRFNNPVRKIVESIRSLNENKELARGTTNEFELIHANIGHMIRVNQEAQRSMQHKQSHLRNYSLMNLLKRIRIEYQEQGTTYEADSRPYRFILLQMNFKPRYWNEMPGEEERTIAYIREYLIQAIGNAMAGAQTFQIETNQILSVVYLGDGDDARLRSELDRIKSVLDTDSAYSFFAIAVSSYYEHASDMTSAYQEALQLISLRPFDDATHILQAGEVHAQPMLQPAALEHELNVSLQEGNDTLALQALRRMMAKMKKKHIAATRFHRFAEETTDKVLRVLHGLQIDSGSLSGIAQSIEKRHTVEELDAYFEELVSEAGRLIRLKKDTHDPIISFTLRYMEEHFSEELSLDIIAGKLNISRGYLSTYFKEMTGANFVDYVNEFRIKQAQVLLLQSELKIQDVALKSGYNTLSSFNRTFKKFTGVTPTEYRRNADAHVDNSST